MFSHYPDSEGAVSHRAEAEQRYLLFQLVFKNCLPCTEGPGVTSPQAHASMSPYGAGAGAIFPVDIFLKLCHLEEGRGPEKGLARNERRKPRRKMTSQDICLGKTETSELWFGK